MKWFNKWLRRLHPWIAFPTALLIPIAVVLKFSGGELLARLPGLEKAQSIYTHSCTGFERSIPVPASLHFSLEAPKAWQTGIII